MKTLQLWPFVSYNGIIHSINRVLFVLIADISGHAVLIPLVLNQGYFTDSWLVRHQLDDLILILSSDGVVNQHNYGKSPFPMGKSTINGHFQ